MLANRSGFFVPNLPAVQVGSVFRAFDVEGQTNKWKTQQNFRHNTIDGGQGTVFSFSAHTSSQPPRKLFILIIHDDIYEVKASQKYFISFRKQKYWQGMHIFAMERVYSPSTSEKDLVNEYWIYHPRKCLYLFSTVPHPHGHWQLQALLGNLNKSVYTYIHKNCIASYEEDVILEDWLSSTMKFFSKFHYFIFGYFDPVNTFFDNKNK